MCVWLRVCALHAFVAIFSLVELKDVRIGLFCVCVCVFAGIQLRALECVGLALMIIGIDQGWVNAEFCSITTKFLPLWTVITQGLLN